MYKVNKLCAMIDCSRNAVMRPEKVKEFIDVIKKFGYNSLMIYLEDTFEVEGEPLFGYLRGRYSIAELQDINDYALSQGIELIPCIQTLAHLNAIFRWGEYAKINDINDILLVGEPRTYQLIDNILSTVDKCFTCKTINLGLDEAHFLGRGKYLDKHGEFDRFDLFCRHLKVVNSLAQKHGLIPIIWSDTFFNKGADGVPYSNLSVPQRALENLPKNVGLICWDYYHTDKDYYDKVLDAHKQFDNQLWYACSAYSSRGFAPCNNYSFKAIGPAMQSCRENGIENVIVTMWGGNGAECSLFALLPSLYYASEVINGNYDVDDIARKFEEITGENFYEMTFLDAPNDVGVQGENYGPSKYVLYNDPFFGIYDCTLIPDGREKYKEYSNKLKEYGERSKYKYIFDTLSSLCSALSIKYDLGLRTRKAYDEKNVDALKELVIDYGKAGNEIEKFYLSFRTQWLTDNKMNGFDVQDLRIGGLLMRIKTCRQRLIDYIDGKINKIEELEERLLDLNTGLTEFSQKVVVLNDWKTNVTVNIL